ncbi:hypothetical protein BDV39DRAFT_200322 [Aspergillus sergii]|uniref:Tat pathway signal sequence n=1 Tax=Aspergillus sergii TaxID=1034303 RepID=A0A5N6XH70_9EURO|nr:hypothetical protein BDV39DRAFT_200322 [Aspergillus sergii]
MPPVALDDMRPSTIAKAYKAPPMLEGQDSVEVAYRRNSSKRLRSIVIAQWIVIAILCLALLAGLLPIRNTGSYHVPKYIYSPAEDVIRYKSIAFSSGLEDSKSKYMGRPTDASNQAWEDLYGPGISVISMDQAARLPNKTAPISESPRQYIVELDVFHQLHCLNLLRLTVWGVDMYSNHDVDIPPHVDHCIESLRQAIMCSADVAPIVWSWEDNEHRLKGHTDTLHTCRDFDLIRQWALEHQAPSFDPSVHVSDPLRSE